MKPHRKTSPARPYLAAFYEGNRLPFVLTLALTVAAFPEGLACSWLLGGVLDCIAAADLARLARLLGLTACFAAGMLLIHLALARVKARFLQRAMDQYRALAFRQLMAKGIHAFPRESAGQYLSALTSDAAVIEENYLERGFLLLYYALLLCGSLGMMFCYSPPLALAALLLTALPLAAALLLGPPLAAREQAVSEGNARFTARLKDLLAGFAVLKSCQAEAEAERGFGAASGALGQALFRRRWWNGVLAALSQNLCAQIMQFGVFFLGAFLAIRGEITAGTVLIFTNLCNFVIQPVTILPQYWAGRRAAYALIGKLADAAAQNAGRTGRRVEPVLREGIVLDKVTFGYAPGVPVLQNLSLRFLPGRAYAVVGGSGSGKTTLLNLLLGACEGYEGSITVDGSELRDIAPESLYELMSLTGQNVFLFDDTLHRNITMFREMPQALVQGAAGRAGLTALLEEKGLDYPCGEGGAALSGGERQRVSIARCLARGTPVLLLDEATAALDQQTAHEVADAILRLDGLTRVVVTHRLDEALLARYDEIIMLQNGRVCERGSFAGLMAQKGLFYALYTLSAGQEGS